MRGIVTSPAMSLSLITLVSSELGPGLNDANYVQVLWVQ